MAKHQFHGHRQGAVGTALRLVTSGCISEAYGRGQPAAPGGKHTGASAPTQDPAQSPEIGHLVLNPLHVHDHVGETCVNQYVTEHVHIGERVHSPGPRCEWSFQRAWARVAIDWSASARSTRLVIRSHGNEVVLGEFLSESERRKLAVTLAAVIGSGAPAGVRGNS